LGLRRLGLAFLGGGFGLLLQRRAQDVAERSARIRRSILGDRLLLFGDLHRLDREVGLLRAVEADNHRVELLADLEAFGALLVAVAAKVAALDEAGRSVVADLDVEPGVLDRANGDGHDIVLVDARSAAAGTRTGSRTLA